jgi:hypothetical protein
VAGVDRLGLAADRVDDFDAGGALVFGEDAAGNGVEADGQLAAFLRVLQRTEDALGRWGNRAP